MSQPARTGVVMRDFPGLVLDADPRDIEAGAAREQVNLTCLTGGLYPRRGLAPLSFEETLDEVRG